jgi:hypothetical protein
VGAEMVFCWRERQQLANYDAVDYNRVGILWFAISDG